jgi:hypothetical protein
MNIHILKHAHLSDIPSASAVEVINGNFYIVGDDSRFLYVLKYDLSIIATVPLYEISSDFIKENRILKKEKADLECIAAFDINGYPHVLILGSGSISPKRDVAFLVKLPTPYNRKHIIWKISLEKWYSFLRLNEDVTGPSGVLNFEAACCNDDSFFLLNRENNALLRFDLPEFIEFIQGHTEGIPFPTVIPCSIPDINGFRAGFSGADIFDNKLFFTASAENTSNAIDDGEIEGSAIGILSFNGEDKVRGKAATGFKAQIDRFEIIPKILNNHLKVESISIYEKEGENSYIGIAVSDDDKGGSDILMLQINL